MCTGIVFDIKEFSINDGPGVRTTVFLKGCPLRCAWCHNPEGISGDPQVNQRSKEIKGTTWESEKLTQKIVTNKDAFSLSGGGVTFSGGEPTAQYDFLVDCVNRLEGVHCLLDTSGYCEEKRFIKLARLFNQIYFDIKLADEETHVRYTGVSNKVILNNLENICEEGINVTIRLPMIPHITDSEVNLAGISDIIRKHCPENTPIHMLPYNRFAEGKYDAYGMDYWLKNGYRVNNYENTKRFADNMRSEGYEVINYLEQETR